MSRTDIDVYAVGCACVRAHLRIRQGARDVSANFDVIVIGGGMAGASVAARLSREVRVLVLERESQPGYHATGRSAAIFSEIYGNAPIRALSRASRDFFLRPPEDFADAPLVSPRGSLYVANADQLERLHAHAQSPGVAAAARLVTASEVRALSPLLREDYVAAGLYEPAASDLDVHALLNGYLRQLRQHGGRLQGDAEVLELQRVGDHWRLHTPAGDFQAPIVINAAGAWVDRIAALAGAEAIGIQPLRRSAALVDAPPNMSITTWPLTIDIEERLYFKPDAGKILISPADETPSEPCDAMPENWDIAVAVERMETITTLQISRVGQQWAGLRSFVAGRSPVVGYDSVLPSFFWLAALGGYGIQTAPAMGRLAAALVLGRELPQDMLAMGLDPASIAPGRLTTRQTAPPARRVVAE
ncbi:MAG: NAD(P)/FAD-dependent oxidoreductase [Rudaea sp.]